MHNTPIGQSKSKSIFSPSNLTVADESTNKVSVTFRISLLFSDLHEIKNKKIINTRYFIINLFKINTSITSIYEYRVIISLSIPIELLIHLSYPTSPPSAVRTHSKHFLPSYGYIGNLLVTAPHSNIPPTTDDPPEHDALYPLESDIPEKKSV